MTDKELLELAAKAAYIEWRPEYSHNRSGLWVGEYYSGKEWNPLTDDGDALRLAVHLNIQVTPGTYNPDEFTAYKAAGGEAHEFRHYTQDAFAATRRAIVRAAAMIGEAKTT